MIQKDIERAVTMIRDYPVEMQTMGSTFVYTITNRRGRRTFELHVDRAGHMHNVNYTLRMNGKTLVTVDALSRAPQDAAAAIAMEMLERMANEKRTILPRVQYAR